MEDIQINFKMIVIIICFAVVGGTLLSLGYNEYIKTDENQKKEEIEHVVEEPKLPTISSSNISNKNDNSIANQDFSLQPNLEKKFKINNEKPKQGLKNWGVVTIPQEKAKYTIKYSIPGSSKKLKGENIGTGVFDMSLWKEDGTYEEFINEFIDELKKQDMGLNITYSTRRLNINGNEYIIVLRESEYILGSYFCLAQNGYACFIEIITNNEDYDNTLENTINNIFSTFTIF